jgi:hypothetical protein
MSEETQELEIGSGDRKLKLRGSDLLTSVIGMVMCSGLAVFGYVLWDHKATGTEINKAVAELVVLQREMNCLLLIPPDLRKDQGGFCKQVSR